MKKKMTWAYKMVGFGLCVTIIGIPFGVIVLALADVLDLMQNGVVVDKKV